MKGYLVPATTTVCMCVLTMCGNIYEKKKQLQRPNDVNKAALCVDICISANQTMKLKRC